MANNSASKIQIMIVSITLNLVSAPSIFSTAIARLQYALDGISKRIIW